MSTATDYVNTWVTERKVHGHSVSLTISASQQARGLAGGAFDLGVAMYAWSGYGVELPPSAGEPGLRFQSVKAWFSDRMVTSGDPLAQRFAANAADSEDVTIVAMPEGSVVLGLASLTWGSQQSAETTEFDATSGQLIFRTAGIGAGAPGCVMLVSFGPGQPTPV